MTQYNAVSYTHLEKRTYLYSSVCFIGTGVNDSCDLSCIVLGHHLILGHNLSLIHI